MRNLALLSLLGVTALATESRAQWLPTGSRFSAGLGWNVLASHPGKPFNKCVEHSAAEKLDGAPTTNVQIKLARSRKELYEHLKLSIEAEASYGLGSASAKTAIDRRASFTSDSVTFVASIDVDYGTWAIANWKLKADYAQLTPAELVRACGDAVITRQRRGATVAVIYSARGLSSEERKRLSIAVEGGYASVSAKSKLSTELKNISKSSRVQTRVYANAGSGPADLGDLMKAGDLDKFQDTLARYVSKLGPDNAATIEYGLQAITKTTVSQPPAAGDLLVEILDAEAELENATECPKTRVDSEALAAWRAYSQKLNAAWQSCDKDSCSVPAGRPGATACKPPFEIHVDTWTGTGKKHGTDDVIHLELMDATGERYRWQLNNPGRDDFQVRADGGRASDHFVLKADAPIEGIKWVELQMSPKKKGAKKLNDWHLSRISIRRDSGVGQELFAWGRGNAHVVVGDGQATQRLPR